MLRTIVARIRGEVHTRSLASFRRGGIEVARLLEELEDTADPWRRPRNEQVAAVAAWNAFVRQTAADRLLDSAYLARDTAAQAHALYAGVREWIVRAREAQANASYRLDRHLPEALPRLLDERYTRSELEALRDAAQAVLAHAEGRASAVEAAAPGERAADAARLRQTTAAARASIDYASGLWARDPSREAAVAIGTELMEALALAHLAGQLAAMPALLSEPLAETAVSRLPPLPGEDGFDPWRLTDPETAARLRVQFAAQPQLAELWEADPDPVRTLALQGEIERAVERGDAQRLPPGTTAIGSISKACPWPAIHVALRPVTIGGTHVAELHSFALTVGADASGFRRALVVGPRIHVPKPRATRPGPSAGGEDDLLFGLLGLGGIASIFDLD